MDIPITFLSDEKGYFDRECPNENCQYTFKIHMEDWKEKVSDDEVHCPMCGYVDTADNWCTQSQLAALHEIVESYAMSLISGELDKVFGGLARSAQHNKYVKITYNPGRRITFKNNPIGQSEEWETDIICEACGTRYSVIGSAYFCPCCGHNSAASAFNESMDSIEKMLSSLSEMKQMLTTSYGRDKAETMCRGLLESSIGDIVSAFQKYAACQYDKLTGKISRVNDFQIVEKGSRLFKAATGKGYEDWLSDNELYKMNILFQRRHLLEHNNGMVDQQYLGKSGDSSYVLGQRLVVKESDAFTLLAIVRKLGIGLSSIKEVPPCQ